MKCFEKLVKDHITSALPDTLDPLQFAYRPIRSTDDAIAIALHTDLTHLDNRTTYVRMLFINWSSAFNMLSSSCMQLRGMPPGGWETTPSDPQHWGPTRVRSQPSPVLPVHP